MQNYIIKMQLYLIHLSQISHTLLKIRGMLDHMWLEMKYLITYLVDELIGVKNWRVNWNELSTMFKYPPEIRKLIYTTNAIENFNRQLRKVTKTKSAFVSDDALMKILYLTTMPIVDKWTMPIRNWGMISVLQGFLCMRFFL